MSEQLTANGIALSGVLVGAIGLGLIWWQVRLQVRLASTAFEDSLVEEYRRLIGNLKYDRMLSSFKDELTDEELIHFFQYFDFCNGQAYLFAEGRISTSVWMEWKDGIRDNFALPAFQQAWAKMESGCRMSFSHLRSKEHPSKLVCPR